MSNDEVPSMVAFATALQAASEVKRQPYNGMFISMPGTITLAARALRELATSPDTDSREALELHEERVMECQPNMRAQGLEDLGRHLGMLKKAVETGDSTTVRQFFEIYRFD